MKHKKVVEMAEYYTARATEYVNAIDRSAAGRFAMDIDEFIAQVALNMHDKDTNWVDNNMQEEEIAYAVAGYLRALCGGALTSAAQGEMLFWRKAARGGWDRNLADGVVNIANPSRSRDYMARLWRVTQYPQYHEYFEVGIWNIADIERFIADGVDPSLARDVVSV